MSGVKWHSVISHQALAYGTGDVRTNKRQYAKKLQGTNRSRRSHNPRPGRVAEQNNTLVEGCVKQRSVQAARSRTGVPQ